MHTADHTVFSPARPILTWCHSRVKNILESILATWLSRCWHTCITVLGLSQFSVGILSEPPAPPGYVAGAYTPR